MSVLSRIKVYGLEDSIRAAKYPKSVNIDSLTDELTDGIKALGQSDPGTGHDQFLTGIIVQFDVTFSIKAWTEAERYHWFDFVSSQSTMHRVTKFMPETQCNEYVDERVIEVLWDKIHAYEDNPTPENYLKVLFNVPTGFRLTARMTTNYRQLKTMRRQRKGHRLPEWKQFCKEVEALPRFMELIEK